MQANIVIAGGGGSGLAAAVAAAGSGISNIIVLEANNAPGGNSLFPRGIFGVESPLQKSLGIDNSRDAAFRQAMAYAHGKLNARLVRTLIDRSVDTLHWLESRGMEFVKLIPHYTNAEFNTYHVASGPENTGAAAVKALANDCREKGVQILLNTRAKKLIADKHGRLKGVVAYSGDGKVDIDTGCVIIATGGFSGNTELLTKYDPLYKETEVLHRGIRQKGDGILMAKEFGAAGDEQVTFEMSGPLCGESMFLSTAGMRPVTMWVNANGERFIDENVVSSMEAANTIYRLPGKVSYSLFDSIVLKSIIKDELTPLEKMRINNRPFREGLARDLGLQSEAGNIKIGDSWNDIAAWAGINAGRLGKTIDEYNRSCDRGYDELFTKDRRYLMPMRQPPYYAIPGRVTILVTHGGIRVNNHMQALDKSGRPIAGLYAAGDDIGETEAINYNISLAGHSFSYALSSGFIAGEQAAIYLSKRG